MATPRLESNNEIELVLEIEIEIHVHFAIVKRKFSCLFQNPENYEEVIEEDEDEDG